VHVCFLASAPAVLRTAVNKHLLLRQECTAAFPRHAECDFERMTRSLLVYPGGNLEFEFSDALLNQSDAIHHIVQGAL
jgi:hypothetical protein